MTDRLEHVLAGNWESWPGRGQAAAACDGACLALVRQRARAQENGGRRRGQLVRALDHDTCVPPTRLPAIHRPQRSASIVYGKFLPRQSSSLGGDNLAAPPAPAGPAL
jgi:hypothetical protein